MSLIRKGLYLGALEEDALPVLHGRPGITHLLSMLPLEQELDLGALAEYRDCLPKAKRLEAVKQVPLMDTNFENLLDRLDECLDFIQGGLKQGGTVLVHCTYGISRSASVITAYLMRSENLSVESALLEVKRLRPQANPSPGFVKQLKLFEGMGCVVDKKGIKYKSFKASNLKNLGNAKKDGYMLWLSQFAVDPSESHETGQGSAMYCKLCLRLVATEANVMGHDGQCGSIFVEPLRWMTGALTVENGELNCLGCGSKLGRFHWGGRPCYCGTLVQPAFQLYGSRVKLGSLAKNVKNARECMKVGVVGWQMWLRVDPGRQAGGCTCWRQPLYAVQRQ